MKENIHPDYQQVVFHDTTVDSYFIVGSTLKTDRTINYQGKTYPYMTIDISSESHPFYTGQQRVAQSEGRVAKFKHKFGNLGG